MPNPPIPPEPAIATGVQPAKELVSNPPFTSTLGSAASARPLLRPRSSRQQVNAWRTWADLVMAVFYLGLPETGHPVTWFLKGRPRSRCSSHRVGAGGMDGR